MVNAVKYTFFFVFLIIILKCDAPRNNPLDVHNPDGQYGLIEGEVLTQSLPYQALPQTRINFTGDSRWAQSDEQGRFSLNKVRLRSGWLYFEKTGYHPDSLFLEWNGSKTKHVEAHLNALPVLDSLIFYSSVTNRYPNVQKLELFIKAWLWDRDNDIDSVFLWCPALNVSLNLQFNSASKYYQRERITLSQLNIELPDELIGHSFILKVKDLNNRRINLAQTQIKRIIREEINPKSPASNETVSTTPTLRWEPINLGYSFTYTVEIRTNEVDPQLVWSKSGLAPTTSQIQVDQPLAREPINQYIWAVWIIDRFGNRARSKFKSFQVE